MSSDNKKQSDSFSLDELKQNATQVPTEAEPKRTAPKERRTSSFIDDADSLLADIRDVVDSEVKSESERVTAERQAAIAARETETELAAEARRKAVSEKLAAEEARRRAVAEDREFRRKTLAGEIVPEEEQAPQEEEPVDSPEHPASAIGFPSVQSAALESPSPKRRGLGFYLLALGLPLLIGVGVFVALDKKDKTKARVSTSNSTPPSKSGAAGGTENSQARQGVRETETQETIEGSGQPNSKPGNLDSAENSPTNSLGAKPTAVTEGGTSKPGGAEDKMPQTGISSTQGTDTAKPTKTKPTKKKRPRVRKRRKKVSDGGRVKPRKKGKKGKKTKGRKRVRISLDEDGD